jgi:RNA polymerase sigma factor (sigma-70 family)
VDIDAYLNDLKHVKILSHQECLELLPKAKAGNQEARHKLIESCLRLAFSKVRDACKGKEIDDEFLTEASIAICRAVDHWDGITAKLSTYVSTAVEHAINDARAQKKIIYIPQWANKRAFRLSQDKEEISSKDEALLQQINKVKTVGSFSCCIEEDKTLEPIDNINRGQQSEVAKQVDEVLSLVRRKQIPKKYRDVLFRYYGLKGRRMTLKEIGDELGLTKEAIRIRLKKVLRWLEQRRICICGNVFDVPTSRKIYCSVKCKSLVRRKFPELLNPRPCKNCGNIFKPKSYISLFCSKKCCNAWWAEKHRKRGKNKRICICCKKEFGVNYATQMYCSKKCWNTDYYKIQQLKKENVEASAKGLLTKKKCKICGNIFKILSKQSNGAKYCSEECRKQSWPIYCCEFCRQKFHARTKAQSRFCSQECFKASVAKKTARCLVCKKVYTKRKATHETCSVSCSNRLKKARRDAKLQKEAC